MHDGFEVLPMRNIGLRYRDPPSRTGRWTDVGLANRSDYFETLVDGNPESLLEQFAIACMPPKIGMSAWGRQPGGGRIKTRFKLDYLRVFQPKNRYSDMEPLYE